MYIKLKQTVIASRDRPFNALDYDCIDTTFLPEDANNVEKKRVFIRNLLEMYTVRVCNYFRDCWNICSMVQYVCISGQVTLSVLTIVVWGAGVP